MPAVNLAQDTTIPPEELIDRLPRDVLDRLPPDVIEQIRDGVIDQIPEEVVDRLPAGIADRIPEGLLASASADPLLTTILIVVGVLAIVGFLYGIVKSAFKAALFAAVVGGGAWYWYFNIR